MVLGITWLETGLAALLIILRAKNASIRPRRPNSTIGFSGLYRLRWDFVWVILAFVGDVEHPITSSLVQINHILPTYVA